MNDEKKSWLDRAGAVHLWKTIEAMLGTKVDKIEGFGLSSNDYTTEEKKKLASLSDPKPARLIKQSWMVLKLKLTIILTRNTKQNRLDYIASVLIIQAMWQQQIK